MKSKRHTAVDIYNDKRILQQVQGQEKKGLIQLKYKPPTPTGLLKASNACPYNKWEKKDPTK